MFKYFVVWKKGQLRSLPDTIHSLNKSMIYFGNSFIFHF